MSVSCRERNYKSFGRCVFLENENTLLGVCIDAGPRIIYYSMKGRENILFEDNERRFSENTDGYGTWYAYGGHRCWIAPEVKPETYYPDNQAVSYSFESGVLHLLPPATPFGKQVELEIELDSRSSSARITQRITNISGKEAVFAPWSVTGLRPGGICMIPLSKRKSGFLPNRVMSLWDYSDIADKRFFISNDMAQVRQDSSEQKAFKAGFNVEDGFTVYAADDQLFIKSFGEYRDVRYPDYSCNFEIYTNSLFLECEVLGEQRSYLSGESAEISEVWQLLDNCSGTLPQIESIKSALIPQKQI